MSASDIWILNCLSFDGCCSLLTHLNIWRVQKSSRPPQDRTMVVACLAEVAQDMGAPIAGYVDVIS